MRLLETNVRGPRDWCPGRPRLFLPSLLQALPGLGLAWPILGNKTKARFSFSEWAPGHAPLHVCLSDQQASSAFFLPSEFISAPVLPCVTFGLQERKRGGV